MNYAYIESFIAVAILLIIYLITKIVDFVTMRKTKNGGFSQSDHSNRMNNIFDDMLNVNDDTTQGGSTATIVKLSDFNNRLKYAPTTIKRTSIHIGQRKLFLNELQFMIKYRPEIVVYAGAAPSMHIWRLHELFPDTKFLLVDPNEFCIIKSKHKTHYDDQTTDDINYLEVGNDAKDYYKGKQLICYQGQIVDKSTVRNIPFTGDIILSTPITIIENLFTMELAERIQKLGKIAFWSDIRTNLNSDKPSELDIYYNSAQQLAWVDILKPTHTMLKFRCPYISNIKDEKPNEDQMDYFDYCRHLGVDFLADYANKKFNYIDGECFIQPWAGCSSSESRLVFSDVAIKEYDCDEYEDKFYYYNNVIRLGLHNDHQICKKYCIDRCGDCALEAHIWSELTQDVLSNMITLENYMGVHGRSLCNGQHGKKY